MLEVDLLSGLADKYLVQLQRTRIMLGLSFVFVIELHFYTTTSLKPNNLDLGHGISSWICAVPVSYIMSIECP